MGSIWDLVSVFVCVSACVSVMLRKVREKHREWHKEFYHSGFTKGYKFEADLERKSLGMQDKDDTLKVRNS